MDTFTQLVNQHINEKMRPDRPTQIQCILFLFKAVDAGEFSKWFKDRHDCSAQNLIQFRTQIKSNGYLLFHLKPYLFMCFKNQYYSSYECLRLAAKYGVNREDTKLVLLMRKPNIRRKLHRLRRYRALTSNGFQKAIADIGESVRPHTNRYVGKKHRFIYLNPHNGLDKEDIVSECIARGLQSVGVQYPEIKNRLHAENIAKRSIKHQGNNIINKMTRLKANPLMKDSQGNHMARVISAEDRDDMSGQNRFARNFQDTSSAEYVENRITIETIYEMCKGKWKEEVAMKALMGIKNPKFSRWLRRNASRHHRKNNDDLMDYLIDRGEYDTYEKYLVKFLSMRPREMNRFKQKLKACMGEE